LSYLKNISISQGIKLYIVKPNSCQIRSPWRWSYRFETCQRK